MSKSGRIILTGRLVNKPELRITKLEVPVATFVVAVRGVKGRGNHYFSCIAWRNLATIAGETLHKGSMVALEGKLENKKYGGRIIKSVSVDNLMLLDSSFSTSFEPFVKKAKKITPIVVSDSATERVVRIA